ncbi:MAG: hypothetical protein K2K24_04510 [Clostridia bacterium]|nr:hypothetical protein [Clostridia bacterium]
MKIYFCKHSADIQKTKESLIKRQFQNDNYQLEYLPSGMPIIVKDGRQAGYVSISHTDDTLIMAFSDKPVGIDIESKNRKVSTKICGSIQEWTRREAYGKFLGVGINKEVLAEQLPDDKINTFFHGDYVVSMCSEEGVESVQTVIDNALDE